jgi:hypothetical protein
MRHGCPRRGTPSPSLGPELTAPLTTQLPRHVRIGTALVSVWALCGIAGVGVGTIVGIVVGALTGLDAWAICVSTLCSLAGYAAWTALRWTVTRRVEHVLLEGVLVTLSVAYCAYEATSQSPRAGLDATMVGLATTLAIGRVGCLFNGCCHGIQG